MDDLEKENEALIAALNHRTLQLAWLTSRMSEIQYTEDYCPPDRKYVECEGDNAKCSACWLRASEEAATRLEGRPGTEWEIDYAGELECVAGKAGDAEA